MPEPTRPARTLSEADSKALLAAHGVPFAPERRAATVDEAVAAAQSGAIDFELLPQGSLAEAIRAGGAGLGGIFTPTAAGTVLAARRETKVIDGKAYVFQPALRGNVALLRAWQADEAGNLVYRMTENNFNQAMAMAADLVLAEVEEIEAADAEAAAEQAEGAEGEADAGEAADAAGEDA